MIYLFIQGSSSDSEEEDGEDGVSVKAFLKKKPEVAPEASKFLKSAKGSGVRGPETIRELQRENDEDLILMYCFSSSPLIG